VAVVLLHRRLLHLLHLLPAVPDDAEKGETLGLALAPRPLVPGVELLRGLRRGHPENELAPSNCVDLGYGPCPGLDPAHFGF